jgi:hypothetical protein
MAKLMKHIEQSEQTENRVEIYYFYIQLNDIDTKWVIDKDWQRNERLRKPDLDCNLF